MSFFKNTTSNMELSFEDEYIRNYVRIWPLEEDLRPGILKLEVDKYFPCRWPEATYIVNRFSQTSRSIPELAFTYLESKAINKKLDRVEIGANDFAIPIIKLNCKPRRVVIPDDRFPRRSKRLLESSASVSNSDSARRTKEKGADESKETSPNLPNNLQTVAGPNKLNMFASLEELCSEFEKANPKAEFVLGISMDKNCKSSLVIPDDRSPRRSKGLIEYSASVSNSDSATRTKEKGADESEETSPNLPNNLETVAGPNKLNMFASLEELCSEFEMANPQAEFVLGISIDKNCKRSLVIPDDRSPRRSERLIKYSASVSNSDSATLTKDKGADNIVSKGKITARDDFKEAASSVHKSHDNGEVTNKSQDNNELVYTWLSQPSNNEFNKKTRQSKIEDYFKVVTPKRSKARQSTILNFFEIIKSTRSQKNLSQDKSKVMNLTTKQRSQGVQTVIESESIQSQGVQTPPDHGTKEIQIKRTPGKIVLNDAEKKCEYEKDI